VSQLSEHETVLTFNTDSAQFQYHPRQLHRYRIINISLFVRCSFDGPGINTTPITCETFCGLPNWYHVVIHINFPAHFIYLPNRTDSPEMLCRFQEVIRPCPDFTDSFHRVSSYIQCVMQSFIMTRQST